MDRISFFTRWLERFALLFSAALLLSNLAAPSRFHPILTSLPLAAAGIAYAILQIRLRPSQTALLRRLLLAFAFVLWAVDQLLPPGRVSILIGDVVISAYVLDLCWMMQAQREPATPVEEAAAAPAHSPASRDPELSQ